MAEFPATRPAECRTCRAPFEAAIVQTGEFGAVVWENGTPVYQDLCPTCRAVEAAAPVPPPLVGGIGV